MSKYDFRYPPAPFCNFQNPNNAGTPNATELAPKSAAIDSHFTCSRIHSPPNIATHPPDCAIHHEVPKRHAAETARTPTTPAVIFGEKSNLMTSRVATAVQRTSNTCETTVAQAEPTKE